MAKGRFLSKKISENEALGDVYEASPLAVLLFTWMIAHLDRDGRHNGNPRVIRGKVVPLLETTPESLRSALRTLAGSGLIRWYRTPCGKDVIWYPRFEENQMGLRRDREAESRWPAWDPATCIDLSIDPTPDPLRRKSGVAPAEVEVEVEVEVEEEINPGLEEIPVTQPPPAPEASALEAGVSPLREQLAAAIENPAPRIGPLDVPEPEPHVVEHEPAPPPVATHLPELAALPTLEGQPITDARLRALASNQLGLGKFHSAPDQARISRELQELLHTGLTRVGAYKLLAGFAMLREQGELVDCGLAPGQPCTPGKILRFTRDKQTGEWVNRMWIGEGDQRNQRHIFDIATEAYEKAHPGDPQGEPVEVEVMGVRLAL